MSEIDKASILLSYQLPLSVAATNANHVVIAGGSASIPTGRPVTVESSQPVPLHYDGIGVDSTRTPETMWPTGPGVQIADAVQGSGACCDCCCEECEDSGSFLCGDDDKKPATKVCGPDVTDWFVEELNLHRNYWHAVAWRSRDEMIKKGRIFERGMQFWEYAASIPYKWLRFMVPFPASICPAGCPSTVTLCDICVNNTDDPGPGILGDIMYGLIGQQFMGPAKPGLKEYSVGWLGGGLVGLAIMHGEFGSGGVARAATIKRAGGTDNPVSMAGILVGMQLCINMDSKPNAWITRQDLCDVLNQNSVKLRESILMNPLTENGITLEKLLGQGTSPLDLIPDDKKAYRDKIKVDCNNCPLPLPLPGPHSDFGAPGMDPTDPVQPTASEWGSVVYAGFKLPFCDRSLLDAKIKTWNK